MLLTLFKGCHYVLLQIHGAVRIGKISAKIQLNVSLKK